MAVSPVLVVRVVGNSSVIVRVRLYDDFNEHEIVLNSVLTYWWANSQPPAVKFLELLDSVIKRTINELMPHKTLDLKYEVRANDNLERASEIQITLVDVVADGIGFKIDEKEIILTGLSKVDEDHEGREFSSTFERVIETPDMVLEQYKKMQENKSS